MKLCIFGAGAVGGLLGVRLANAGADVSLVARGAHLDALRRNGATLLVGNERIEARIRCSDRPAELGVQDVVILAVKAPAAPAAARAMAPLLGPETAVVTAMNGIPYWYFWHLAGPWRDHRLRSVDPHGEQWDAIAPRRAIGCVVYAAGAIEAPGIIRHLSGQRFIVGEPNGSTSPRVQRLSDALTAAGLDAPVSTDIRKDIWIKLWGNLSFNPVSVLTHATLDVLAIESDSQAAIRPMMAESRDVAHRLGVEMPLAIEARIAMAAKVGAHKTSMLQDLQRGQKLEIDALLGVVVEMGRLVGVATPICELILGLVRQRARSASAP
jgi:2-dehydropantoate 2-reductase